MRYSSVFPKSYTYQNPVFFNTTTIQTVSCL